MTQTNPTGCPTWGAGLELAYRADRWNTLQPGEVSGR